MATTSSSPRPAADCWLRLVDVASGSFVDFPLGRALRASAGMDLAGEGAVHESHAYEVHLVTQEALPEGEVLWSVNGEDDVRLTPCPVSGAQEGLDDPFVVRLQPDAPGRWTPFAMTYGFARVTLVLPDGMALATRDIACACDREDQEAPVAAMVAELMGSSGPEAARGADAEAMRWMLGDAPGTSGALVDAGAPTDGSRSLAAFISLVEGVLGGLARTCGYLSTRAYSRTVKADVCVGPSQVRQLGRRELAWLAANPDALRPAPGPAGALGAAYEVTRLRTERPQTTRDVAENRAVLAFAHAVTASLGRVADEADALLARLRQTRDRLRELVGERGLTASLVVIDACLAREEPLAGRVRALVRRARRVERGLGQALPGVTLARWRLPRRTKPFQEIPAYVGLYELMRRWEAFGEFGLARDGLVLRTWRMDKLYEYYVLYRLLSALRQAGFSPDEAAGEPLLRACYSLQDPDYADECQVATVYALVRGDERVTLHYQPVLYADGREENGVRLHRTSCSAWRPYWTPDYLLTLERGGRRTTVVLDAKFRRPGDVQRVSEVSVGPGISVQTESTLRECLRKYKLETAGAGGARVDAVWLVCGRATSPYAWQLQHAAWARGQADLACDGVVTLAPGADALHVLLAELGISAG